MSELDNFFEMLAGACPAVTTPANMDSIAPEELAPASSTSTSNDMLLEKISALENMIAEMKNNNNGVHIEN